jgi:antitoxin HicB
MILFCYLIKMKTNTFIVLLEPDIEGKYQVSCPSLEGCQSQGNTIDEAITKIKDVIELYLEDIRERNEKIPDHSRTVVSLVTIEEGRIQEKIIESLIKL